MNQFWFITLPWSSPLSVSLSQIVDMNRILRGFEIVPVCGSLDFSRAEWHSSKTFPHLVLWCCCWRTPSLSELPHSSSVGLRTGDYKVHCIWSTSRTFQQTLVPCLEASDFNTFSTYLETVWFSHPEKSSHPQLVRYWCLSWPLVSHPDAGIPFGISQWCTRA